MKKKRILLMLALLLLGGVVATNQSTQAKYANEKRYIIQFDTPIIKNSSEISDEKTLETQEQIDSQTSESIVESSEEMTVPVDTTETTIQENPETIGIVEPGYSEVETDISENLSRPSLIEEEE